MRYRQWRWLALAFVACALWACGSEGTEYGWSLRNQPGGESDTDELPVVDAAAPDVRDPGDVSSDVESDGVAVDAREPDIRPDVEPDVFDPPAHWYEMEGFTESNVLSRVGEHLIVRSTSGDGIGEDYTASGIGWRDVSSLDYSDQIGFDFVRADLAATDDEGRYLLVEYSAADPRLWHAPKGSSTFSEATLSGLSDSVREIVEYKGDLVVRTTKSVYRRDDPSESWREIPPLLFERDVTDMAVRAGRLYLIKKKMFPGNSRWAVHDSNGGGWTMYLESSPGTPVDPEKWAVIGDMVYAVDPRLPSKPFTGTVHILKSGPGGALSRIAIQTPVDFSPGQLAGLGGQLYGVGEGQLYRIDVSAGTVTRQTSRSIGTVPVLYRIGDRLVADASVGTALVWEKGDSQWRVPKLSSGVADQVFVADGRVFARTVWGMVLRFDRSERVWRLANSRHHERPFHQVFRAGSKWFAHADDSCLWSSDDGVNWSPLMRWVVGSDIELGDCVSHARGTRVVDVASVGGEYYVAYDGGDAADRLVKWQPGSTSLQEVSNGSVWDGFETLQEIAGTRNEIWVSRCPALDTTICYLSGHSHTPVPVEFSTGGPFGPEGMTGEIAGVGEWVFVLTAPYSSGASQYGRARAGMGNGARFQTSTRNPRYLHHDVTRLGPMATTEANDLRRYDVANDSWEVFESLPGEDARVNDIAVTSRRVVVALESGGIWTKVLQ